MHKYIRTVTMYQNFYGGGALEYTDCISAGMWHFPYNECPGYDMAQSAEAVEYTNCISTER